MNKYIQEFLEINKQLISSVCEFICSSQEKIIYIFLKAKGCKNMELLTEAEFDEGITVYILSTEYEIEKTVKERVPLYAKI